MISYYPAVLPVITTSTHSGAAPEARDPLDALPPLLLVAPLAFASLIMSLASPLVNPSLIWSSCPRRLMNCFLWVRHHSHPSQQQHPGRSHGLYNLTHWLTVASWLADGPVGMVEPGRGWGEALT